MYTLTLCIGIFLGLCGQVRTYDYPTLAECEAARKGISARTLGDGYSICALKYNPKEEK